MLDFHEYSRQFFTIYTAMLAIVDPFAVIPVFLGITKGYTSTQQSRVCSKAVVVSGAILLLFAISGQRIFQLFGISIPAFQIAGGILLLLLGIAQLGAHRERVSEDETDESLEREDISIFPLATPLLAGPGSISTVVLHSSQTSGYLSTAVFFLAIVSCLLTCYALLRAAPLVYKFLGRTGLNLLTRVMGVLLTAIAVQFIIDGIRGVLVQFGFLT